MIEREHVNVVIEASMIYLDDYHHREGTRIAVKWTRSVPLRYPSIIPNHALSEIEFDDRIGVLKTWREALFDADDVIMDQSAAAPIMLASVNQYVFASIHPSG